MAEGIIRHDVKYIRCHRLFSIILISNFYPLFVHRLGQNNNKVRMVVLLCLYDITHSTDCFEKFGVGLIRVSFRVYVFALPVFFFL